MLYRSVQSCSPSRLHQPATTFGLNTALPKSLPFLNRYSFPPQLSYQPRLTFLSSSSSSPLSSRPISPAVRYPPSGQRHNVFTRGVGERACERGSLPLSKPTL